PDRDRNRGASPTSRPRRAPPCAPPLQRARARLRPATGRRAAQAASSPLGGPEPSRRTRGHRVSSHRHQERARHADDTQNEEDFPMKITIKEARDYAFKVALKKGATKQEVRRGLFNFITVTSRNEL